MLRSRNIDSPSVMPLGAWAQCLTAHGADISCETIRLIGCSHLPGMPPNVARQLTIAVNELLPLSRALLLGALAASLSARWPHTPRRDDELQARGRGSRDRRTHRGYSRE